MKRLAKIAILLCICVLALVGVAACSSVTGISLESKNNTALQTVFVEGQELDLSGGALTVTTGDETEIIPLTSEGVTVTGYDSSVLGRQTLTITYGGKTTTLTVTVVQRIVAVSFSSEYFVGDTFNKDKGVLQITRDDGTSFNVNMSDDTVSVINFDSSVAGEREVTLSYKSGTEEYTDSITVTVYDVADITIKKPNKITYKSHETELDLSGGYITVKNAAGTYSKSLSLTEDMVTGFDLSVATYENSRNTELDQVLTITYGNKTTNFTISISYSNVSVIQDCAEELSALDWSSSIPEITDSQGELAIEALSLFASLSDDDKTYIDEDVYLAVARVAAVYGLAEINKVLDNNKAVLIYENGEFGFISCGYEDAKLDYANLSADTILNIADQLVYIIAYYGTETLYGSVILSDYLQMVTLYINCVNLLGQLFNYYEIFEYSYYYTYEEVEEGKGGYVYDSATDSYVKAEDGKGNYDQVMVESGVPTDWTTDSSDSKYLGNYTEAITTVYSYIVYGDYFNVYYRSAYSLLAEWRSDFFTAMYQYWALFNEETAQTAAANLSIVYLTYPYDEIDELTTLLYSECNYIYLYMAYSYAYDTTAFMYYYDQYIEYLEIARNSTDRVTQILYEVLPIYVFYDNEGNYVSQTIAEWLSMFTYASYSYNGRTYYYTGIDEVDDLWTDYIAVYGDYLTAVTGEDFTMQTFAADEGAEIAAMFDKFVALTPTQQYAFLRSVNACYMYGAPILGLDLTQTSVYSYFAYFVYYYYNTNLTDDEFDIFTNILIALEYYARQNDFSSGSGLQAFLYYMDAAITDYNTLKGDDDSVGAVGVTNFNKYAGTLYNKYVAIYNLYDSEGNYSGSTDLGEWADEFEELAASLSDVYTAYYNYSSKGYYIAIYSAFETAEAIAEKIVSGAPASVLNAYYYMPVSVTVGSSTKSWSLDYTLSYMREYYGYYMSYVTVNGSALKNVYKTSGLQTFMSELNYVFRISLNYDAATYTTYDATTVLSIMSDFRSLTNEQRYLFLQMDTSGTMHYDDSLYYAALNDFFGCLSDGGANVASRLMRAEVAYLFYEADPDGIDIDGYYTSYTFTTNMGYVITDYNALSAEDKAEFDSLLGDVYNLYLAVYNAINA